MIMQLHDYGDNYTIITRLYIYMDIQWITCELHDYWEYLVDTDAWWVSDKFLECPK